MMSNSLLVERIPERELKDGGGPGLGPGLGHGIPERELKVR